MGSNEPVEACDPLTQTALKALRKSPFLGASNPCGQLFQALVCCSATCTLKVTSSTLIQAAQKTQFSRNHRYSTPLSLLNIARAI